ncbi:MAG: DUF4832 domain-containing protein [Trueperaceae bacterium]
MKDVIKFWLLRRVRSSLNISFGLLGILSLAACGSDTSSYGGLTFEDPKIIEDGRGTGKREEVEKPSEEPLAPIQESNISVSYQGDNSDFANPDRGYYFAHVMSASNPKVIDPTNIQRMKDEKITIFKRIYNLDTFKSSVISASFLEWIQKDLEVVRENGLKVALRFAYNFNDGSDSDAPLSVVLGHIGQLAPILKNNVDIIAFMDAGFIGKWGEWHSSTNNLTEASSQKQILEKLLSALPPERMVVVRVPKYKKAIYGDAALIEEDAFKGDNRARVGHKNDCFTAETDNYGTYWPIDEKSLESQKNYLSQENQYLPQAGETCGYFGSYSECANAVTDLRKMRWTSLGRLPSEFIDAWTSQGCYDDISRNLGYRYRLLQGSLPVSVNRNGTLNVGLRMTNDGYAGLYNPRMMQVVLRNKATEKEARLTIVPEKDLRLYLPTSGETTDLSLSAQLPAEVEAGEYDLFLYLPDPTLYGKVPYSIRLANTNMWESETGLNKLGSIKIK